MAASRRCTPSSQIFSFSEVYIKKIQEESELFSTDLHDVIVDVPDPEKNSTGDPPVHHHHHHHYHYYCIVPVDMKILLKYGLRRVCIR